MLCIQLQVLQYGHQRDTRQQTLTSRLTIRLLWNGLPNERIQQKFISFWNTSPLITEHYAVLSFALKPSGTKILFTLNIQVWQEYISPSR